MTEGVQDYFIVDGKDPRTGLPMWKNDFLSLTEESLVGSTTEIDGVNISQAIHEGKFVTGMHRVQKMDSGFNPEEIRKVRENKKYIPVIKVFGRSAMALAIDKGLKTSIDISKVDDNGDTGTSWPVVLVNGRNEAAGTLKDYSRIRLLPSYRKSFELIRQGKNLTLKYKTQDEV